VCWFVGTELCEQTLWRSVREEGTETSRVQSGGRAPRWPPETLNPMVKSEGRDFRVGPPWAEW
jgi:hypothetical protein